MNTDFVVVTAVQTLRSVFLLLQKNEPLHCLKCGAKMELELWNRLVDAFWTIEEINLDFSKANLEKRAAKFDIRITDSNSDTVI